MWKFLLLVVAWASAQDLQQLSHPMKLGEGPHWSAQEQALYWVDIKQQNVWRLDPESGNITTCHIAEGEVSVIVPIKNETGKFAVGVKDKLKILTWDGRNGSTIDVSKTIANVPTPEGGRSNDGKVDAAGRFWIGTIGFEENNTVDPNKAGFFRIGCGNNTAEAFLQVGNITVSNGIAWSADGNIMYYIDSPTRKIDAFDFDPADGSISNRRTAFDLDTHNITGVPDGMTIDKDDNLWVALYGGEGVIEIQPHLGRLLKTYPIPGVPQVTSVTWGGPNLDILYITSAVTDEGKGGQLYRLTGTGARGRPANDYVVPTCNKNKKS